MVKRIFKWKPVRLRSIHGNEYLDAFLPMIIAKCYKGELVEKILLMAKKNPISFHDALEMASEYNYHAMKSGRSGHKPRETFWYYYSFLDFVSEEGFHIELTGEEFESPASVSS